MIDAGEICRQLLGKSKDKSNALTALKYWVDESREQQKENRLSIHEMKRLLTTYIQFFEKEIESLQKKANSSASLNQLALICKIFKDLCFLAHPDSITMSHWNYILDTLEMPNNRSIVQCSLSSSLMSFCRHRKLMNRLSDKNWESTLSYCTDFFVEEYKKSGEVTMDRADRRPECQDIGLCFGFLISSDKHQHLVLQHSNRLLTFISTYTTICYTVENQAFEYLLGAAVKILVLLDLEDLDLTFAFLKMLRLSEWIKTKHESLRIIIVYLIRMYIAVGSWAAIEDEFGFMERANRTQLALFQIIERRPATLPIKYLYSIVSEAGNELIPENLYPIISTLKAVAEISNMKFDSFADSPNQSPLFDERPPKRIKSSDVEAIIGKMLNHDSYNLQIMGLQAINFLQIKNSASENLILKGYLKTIIGIFKSPTDSIVLENSALSLHHLLECENLFDQVQERDIYEICVQRLSTGHKDLTGTFLLLSKLVLKITPSPEDLNSFISKFSNIAEFPQAGIFLGNLLSCKSIANQGSIAPLVSSIFETAAKLKDNMLISNFFMDLLLGLSTNTEGKEAQPLFGVLYSKAHFSDASYFDSKFESMKSRLILQSGGENSLLLAEYLHTESHIMTKESKKLYLLSQLALYFGDLIFKMTDGIYENQKLILFAIIFCRFLQIFPMLFKHLKGKVDFMAQLTKLNDMIWDLDFSVFEIDVTFMLCTKPVISKHIFWPLDESLSIKFLEKCFGNGLMSVPIVERNFNTLKYRIFNPGIESDMDLKFLIHAQQQSYILGALAPSLTNFECTGIQSFLLDMLQSNYYLAYGIAIKSKMRNILHLMAPETILEILTNYLDHRDEDFSQWDLAFSFILDIYESKLVLNNMSDINRTVSIGLEYFLKQYRYFPVDLRIAVSNVFLALEKYDQDKIYFSDLDGINYSSGLLEHNNMEYSLYFAVHFLPTSRQINSFNDSIIHHIVDNVEKFIKLENTTDIQNISASMIFGSLLNSSHEHHSFALRCLLKLAFDQPGLDIVQSILEKVSIWNGFTQPMNLIEGLLNSVLREWTDELEKFPIFILGFESEDDFLNSFSESIALYYYERNVLNDILLLPNIEKNVHLIFSQLYVRYLFEMQSDSPKAVELEVFLKNLTKDSIEDCRAKNAVGIAKRILLESNGVSSSPIIEFNSSGMKIEKILEWRTKSNIQQILNALSHLFNCQDRGNGWKLNISDYFGALNLPFQQLFHKLHIHILNLGFIHDKLELLENGYSVLLILSGKALTEPFLFRSILRQLLEFTSDRHLSFQASQLIAFVIDKCNSFGNFKGIVYNHLQIVSKIGYQCQKLCREGEPQDSKLVRSLIKCISLMKETLIAHLPSHEAKSLIGVFLAGLDISLPCFTYLKFHLTENEEADALVSWLIQIEPQMIHSEYPFEKFLTLIPRYTYFRSRLGAIIEKFGFIIRESSIGEEIRYVCSKCLALLRVVYVPVENPSGQDIVEITDCYNGFIVATEELYKNLFHQDMKISTLCMNLVARLNRTKDGQNAFQRCRDIIREHFQVLYSLPGSSFKLIDPPAELPLSNSAIWFSAEVESSLWLTRFAGAALYVKSPTFFKCLAPLLRQCAEFSEKMIPYLIHCALEEEEFSAERPIRNVISQNLSYFLQNSTPNDHFALKNLLEIIKHLFKTPGTDRFQPWIDIDYIEFSKNIASIGHYVESLFFLEYQFIMDQDFDLSASSMWKTLLNSYRGLNDTDGFHGVISCINTSSIELLDLVKEKHILDKDWKKMWALEDSLLQAQAVESDKSLLIKSLSSSGHLATFNLMNQTQDGISDEQYESMWRLGVWPCVSDFSQNSHNESSPNFKILKNIQLIGQNIPLEDIVNNIKQDIIHLSDSNDFNWGLLLSTIEIQEACELKSDETNLTSIFETWDSRKQLLLKNYPFKTVEPILAVRGQIFKKLAIQSSDSRNIWEARKKHLYDLANLYIENKELILARTALIELQTAYPEKTRIESLKLRMMELKLEWERGEQTIAIKYFKTLIESFKPTLEHEKYFYSEMYNTYGLMAIQSKKQMPKVIVEQYLIPSVEFEPLDTKCHAFGKYHYDLADYCNGIINEMESDENYFRSVKLLETRKSDLAQIKNQPSRSSLVFIRKLEKQIHIDEMEIESIKNRKNMYLTRCIESYLKSLAYSVKIEHSLFRLSSLWLSNSSNTQVNQLVKKFYKQVPTKSFLILIYQLSAQFAMVNIDKEFQKNLGLILYDIVMDYPYQSLPYILALKNVSGENRHKIKPENQEICGILRGLDNLFDGYIAAAVQPPPTKDKPKIKAILDPSSNLLKSFPVPMPIISIEQSTSSPRNYSDIIYIESFSPNYSLAGGINVPKVLQCQGSDGKTYRQLVKSNDDLRQDAVISSVFNMINNLLVKRGSKLSIRTYKIVPLQAQAGVLQWLDETIPFGNFLMSFNEKMPVLFNNARKLMKQEHDKPKSTLKSKRRVFEAIKNEIPLIFGRLFFDLFRDPKSWYEHRNRYMKSCAASSISGWMLGLGDRHCQNLLFDQKTGEIIHIDLGIAFDQGRLLSTPETVPFRLTRNMVNGMGITGYEGVFKRGCEETLNVLRQECDLLFTLLDVFRKDPLHSWTLSPLKLKNVQNDYSDGAGLDQEGIFFKRDSTISGNKEAEVALFGVKKKLSSNLSVECQVQQLINIATDEDNLCKLYPGWQPWL